MRILRRGLYSLVIVLLGLLPALYGVPLKLETTQASGNLEMLRDIISSDTIGARDVQHFISFILPVSAQQVTPSDWILIDLPHFSEISLPQDVMGGYGTPSVSISGNTIRITNIVLLSGTSLQAFGIVATNPWNATDFGFSVRVSSDMNGTSIRNAGNSVASTTRDWITVSATITTTTPSLTMSGWSSPNAFVTLTESDSVLGTTVAGLTGFFTFSLTGLDEGDHSYRLYATDTLGRSTSQTVENLYLVRSTLTDVANIILSSTMALDKTSINPGDTITISGAAMPGGQINLFVESPLRSYTAQVNGSGDWSYTIPGTETKDFSPGEYRTYSIVQDQYASQSVVSNTLTFTVNTPQEDNPPPACDISKGDLNCDGKVNLTDFSILLYHWQTNHKKADINADGKVNLVDFSIMMFYFQR